MVLFPSSPFFEEWKLPLGPFEFRSMYYVLVAALIWRNSDMQHFMKNDALYRKTRHIRPVIRPCNGNKAVPLP